MIYILFSVIISRRDNSQDDRVLAVLLQSRKSQYEISSAIFRIEIENRIEIKSCRVKNTLAQEKDSKIYLSDLKNLDRMFGVVKNLKFFFLDRFSHCDFFTKIFLRLIISAIS